MSYRVMLIGLSVSGVYAVMRGTAPDAEPVFAQPAPVALARLAAKSRVVEGTGLGSLMLTGRGGATDTVVIALRQAGDEHALTCRVVVQAIDPVQSRADTDCTQHTAADAKTRALGKKALEIIVREHVAATVEDRRYDIEAVGNRMLTFAAFNGAALMAGEAGN